MHNVAPKRITIPEPATDELLRKNLIKSILDSPQKLIYIYAPGGYGKTTLLSQIAHVVNHTVWLSIDGENDPFTFISSLSQAIQHVFSKYDFEASDYLYYSNKDNGTQLLSNSFLKSIEVLNESFTLMLDDLHKITNLSLKEFIVYLLKYFPENVRVCISSRDTPWQELIPLRIRGYILELSHADLALNHEEMIQLLGFKHTEVFKLTEGWPLGLSSFRQLFENGYRKDHLVMGKNDSLNEYLFHEYTSQLHQEAMDLLNVSVHFDEFDPSLLDHLLNQTNSENILENLLKHNSFTIKEKNSTYRFHSIFREHLMISSQDSPDIFFEKAANYYYTNNQFILAGKYAIMANKKPLLEKIVLREFLSLLHSGYYNQLEQWFDYLELEHTESSSDILLAKGVFLSTIGHFVEAKTYFDTVIPLLKIKERDSYFTAMIHSARVIRNTESFDASNIILDQLLNIEPQRIDELSYQVVIEKLYNLCWNSQLKEALMLCNSMIENCHHVQNTKLKKWFERYLCAIYFFLGQINKCLHYYERSLEIPEDEQQLLGTHLISPFAAKAYQINGQHQKAMELICKTIDTVKSQGILEELWLIYLIAAEMNYYNTCHLNANGGSESFHLTNHYMALSLEFAPSHRTAPFYLDYIRHYQTVFELMNSGDLKHNVIRKLTNDINQVGDYLKATIHVWISNYYMSINELDQANKYALKCIEIAESSNILEALIYAYFNAAKIAIFNGSQKRAIILTKRYLDLCYKNGIYLQLQQQSTHNIIFDYAIEHEIKPEMTLKIMNYVGYNQQKVYIQTLGGLCLCSFLDRKIQFKMRSKKERELLAFLLDAGKQGVNKEQIYNALWSESDSNDIKKLIGVNLAHIKKDFAHMGIENAIINIDKHYHINRDEIVLDIDLFDVAIEYFNRNKNIHTAEKVLSLYKGDYLSDTEALWAISKRLSYQKAYSNALNFMQKLAWNESMPLPPLQM